MSDWKNIRGSAGGEASPGKKIHNQGIATFGSEIREGPGGIAYQQRTDPAGHGDWEPATYANGPTNAPAGAKKIGQK